MKFLKLFISSVFVLVSILVAPAIFAEGELTTGNTKTENSNAVITSTVNIEEWRILSQDNNNFKISFDLTNKEGLQSGLKYGVELIGQNDKGQYMADEKVYPENITLYENSRVSKEISYTAPSNLTGDYTLWITVKNTSGFRFGIVFVGKVTLTASAKGVNILPESCSLSIPGVKDTYTLAEGVSIHVNEHLVLNCRAINSSNKELSVVPFFETTYRTLYGEVVPTSGGDVTPIIFKAGEEKSIAIALPKALAPQAYDVQTSLKEGENTSNIIVTHYVLGGVSATIQNVYLDKDYYQKGDIANLSFIWSSNADNFPGSRTNTSSIKPTIIAEITNSKGKLCAPTLNQLMPENLSPNVEIPITITSLCKNPQVIVSLKDSNDNILSEQNFSIETQSKSTNSIKVIYYVFIILVFLIIIISLFIKNKKNSKTIPFHVLFPFLLLVAIGSMIPFNAKAFTVGNENGVNAEITISGIQSSYSPGEMIYLSAAADVTACSNAVTGLKVNASNNFNGISQTMINSSVSGGSALRGSADFVAPRIPGNYYISVSGNFGTNGFNKSFPFSVSGSVDGKCYSQHYYCSPGTADIIPDTIEETSWKWYCRGFEGGTDSPLCSETKSPINGVCSGSKDSCYYGTYVDTEDDSSYYKWSCNGLYGGTNATNCSSLIPPSCGSEVDTCIQGTLVGENTSMETLYPYKDWWICKPNNGGSNMGCSKLKYGTEEPGGMSGIININECKINLGESSCSASVHWSVTNPEGASFLRKTSQSGENIPVENEDSFSVIHMGNNALSYYLYNNNKMLNFAWVGTPMCDQSSGYTMWDGVKCSLVPINGGWSSWYNGACIPDVPCNGEERYGTPGTITSTRTCTNPIPKNGGADCSLVDGGNTTKVGLCTAQCYINPPQNLPPTNPVISGPTSGDMGVSQIFNFLATDPEGTQIRYGIDWNPTDGVVDDWVPAEIGGTMDHVASGTSKSISKSWPSFGTFTFKVMAQDYPDANLQTRNSEWVPWTITINKNTNLNATLLPETQIIKKGDSATLTWASVNTRDINSCVGTGDGFVTGGAKGGSDNVSPTILGVNNYSVTCYGKIGNIFSTNNPSTITKTAIVKVIDTSFCQSHPSDPDCVAFCDLHHTDPICIPPSEDLCRNLDGTQNPIPSDRTRTTDGDCLTYCQLHRTDSSCTNPNHCIQNPADPFCHCTDGLKNQDEINKDCGGSCNSCSKNPPIIIEI